MLRSRNPHLFAIADSDLAYKSILINRLCKSPARKSSFCATTGFELLVNLPKNKTDVLIVDLFMPGLSGFEAIDMIRETNEDIIIIACSINFQAKLVPLLKDMKVNRYCPKDVMMIETLMDEVGETRHLNFDESLFAEWEKQTRNFAIPKHAYHQETALKPVQTQLTRLVCDGKTNKEIATIMHLSIRTIDTYINQLLQQLTLRNRQELITYAFKNNICHSLCDIGREGNCNVQSLFRDYN